MNDTSQQSLTAIQEQIVSLRLTDSPDTEALADALNQLSSQLAERARAQEAAEAADEACLLYRQLARKDERYRPDLAMGLNNLANRLLVMGRYDAALESARESVSHYRLLSDDDTAHTPQLAIALGALGTILLHRKGQAAEAAACFAEGIERLTPLCLRHPQDHRDLIRQLAEHYLPTCLTAGIEPDMRLIESFADAFQDPDRKA